MEAGESPARSRHCNEGAAVYRDATAKRSGFAGRRTAARISESGNMHEAASFTVPEKHRVKFFIGEMQHMEESICLMKEKGTAKTGCSRRKRVPQAAAF